MSTTKLETFVKSLPTKSTSALLCLLFDPDRYYGLDALSHFVTDESDAAVQRLTNCNKARDALRAEIDERFPPPQKAS